MALSSFRKVNAELCMEALGTFALLYTIQTAASAASSAFPFAIGLVLVVFIYIGATVSGSNFNPAVTVGLFLRGKMSFGKGIQYIIAQLVGGVLGSFLGKLSSGSISVPHTGKDYNLIQALIVEAIFTAFLLVIVLGCMTMAANKDNQFYGVAIGLTITVGIICAQSISGAVFNPAVALSLVLINDWTGIFYALCIIGAQVAGAILGTVAFFFIAPEDFPELDLNESAKGAHERLLQS